jgi:hypothetical protein
MQLGFLQDFKRYTKARLQLSAGALIGVEQILHARPFIHHKAFHRPIKKCEVLPDLAAQIFVQHGVCREPRAPYPTECP